VLVDQFVDGLERISFAGTHRDSHFLLQQNELVLKAIRRTLGDLCGDRGRAANSIHLTRQQGLHGRSVVIEAADVCILGATLVTAMSWVLARATPMRLPARSSAEAILASFPPNTTICAAE